MKSYHFIIIALLSFLLTINSCIASTKDDQKEKIENIDQLQLQEDMQRFYSRFYSRLIEAISRDEDFRKEHNRVLLRSYIDYSSEALKIVSSPYPVANFLDMLVFIKLNKIVIHDYWIPKVYGHEGRPILRAFMESEKDLEALARKFMKAPNLKYIGQMVYEWRKQNPNYINVSQIRLSDFTKIGLIKQKSDPDFSLSGLVVDTQSAVKAVDEIVLVSNRAIFLSQNLIGLTRLNMRLGAQEIITDTVSNFQSAGKITNELEKTRPLVHDLTYLTQESGTLIKDLQSLLRQIKEKELKGINVEKNLDQMNSMLDKANSIVTTLNSGSKQRKEIIGSVRDEVKAFTWLIALAIIVTGFFVSLFWWTGHYLCKRKLNTT